MASRQEDAPVLALTRCLDGGYVVEYAERSQWTAIFAGTREECLAYMTQHFAALDAMIRKNDLERFKEPKPPTNE